MKALYLSQARIPSNQANSVHVCKMCAAFSKANVEVELLGYRGGNDDPSRYYGLDGDFKLTTFDIAQRPGESIVLALKYRNWISSRNKSGDDFDFVYSRSAICSLINSNIPAKHILEIHSSPRTTLHEHIEKCFFGSKHFFKAVFISQALQDYYITRFRKLNSANTLVLPDGADPFPENPPKAKLPKGINIGYVGHLYPGKGGEFIIRLAKALPDYNFHIVGGQPKDIERLMSQKPSKNLTFHGHIPHVETIAYLHAFDIAIAPYSEKVNLAKTSADIGKWMSPLKLFEYMSSGTPLITSNLPVLREIIQHNRNGLLANPDCLDDWKIKLTELAKDSALRTSLGERARTLFHEQYTWQRRAENILKALHFPQQN